jgi:tetratricopeptide (TPR) repeat protein
LLNTYEEVKAETERLKDHDVIFVQYGSHLREVLYKNKDDIYWVGAVHENLNKRATATANIHKKIGYSEAHKLDPERNLRILLKEEKTKRVKFYLGREYFEHRKYDESIKWMTDYLSEATWVQEIAEAHLTIAKCYWFTKRGDKSREACLKAIGTNPDFKEALTLMSEMTYEPLKTKWLNISKIATNKDVLFIR